MSDPRPDVRQQVAIVIVTFNARDELAGCLQSLERQTESYASAIAVVDNGSTDGTADMVKRRWPAVRLIEAGSNLGFSRANNVGIRATDSEYVLLLNPDTLVSRDAISRLIRKLAAHPEAAAAGPRLIDETGRPELSFGWPISPLGELRQKLLGALYHRGFRPAVDRVVRWTTEEGEREWLSGACFLVRRADLEAVGLLDERYFMYTEDVDLCVELRKRGRKILFVPEVEVTHLRGRSAGRNPHTAGLKRRSQLAYYAKHHPSWAPILKLYLKVTGKASGG